MINHCDVFIRGLGFFCVLGGFVVVGFSWLGNLNEVVVCYTWILEVMRKEPCLEGI